MTLDNRMPSYTGQDRRARAKPALILVLTALSLIAAPVALFSEQTIFDWNTAHAGQGGNGGGGNGGGGNGGGGNGGGGNGGGGNGGGGGGDPGGSGNGGGNTGNGGDPASAELEKGGSGKKGLQLLHPEQGVALAQFTTKISKRYPADNVALHQAPHQAITFFTEVQGLAGRILTHRWIYQGRIEYQTEFKIRGTKWKSWSTQVLPAEKAGQWTVEIVDDNGTVLTTRSLEYEPVETATAEAGDS